MNLIKLTLLWGILVMIPGVGVWGWLAAEWGIKPLPFITLSIIGISVVAAVPWLVAWLKPDWFTE